MNDSDILKQIQALVDEEHALMIHKNQGGLLSEEQLARIKSIDISLDQHWDLLRQRRARRAAGLDPDGAHERDANTVEHYQQ